MRKFNFFFGVALLAAVAFFGCKPTENKAIIVADNASLTQEVFADQTQGTSGVSITTTGAWTSSFAEKTPANAPTRGNSLDWVSISPDHGDAAGTYNISITLEENLTGEDRAAEITISCENEEIVIYVMQKAVTSAGMEYVEFRGGNFSKDYSDNSYYFMLYLAQTGLYSANNELQKNGNEYEILLKLSAATKENGYYVPQEGEYIVGENLDFGQAISYYNYQNYTANFIQFETGKLTVKKIENGYRIDVDIVGNEGSIHKLRYEGELKTNDYTEPEAGETNTTNFTLNQIGAYHHNFGNIQGWGNDFVYFSISDNNNTIQSTLNFLLPTGSTSIPAGTYQINATRETNTLYSPTSILRSTTIDGYYTNWSYSFVSGTVEVTSNGFTVNAISAGGTAVTINYTGSLGLIRL